MDVDLQDPPELLGEMIARWRAGYDVVLPQRRNRDGEPWIKKIVAALGYRVIRKIAEVPIPPDTGDFRLMSRRVVNEVVRLKECHGFLRGLVALVGFKQCQIPFDRPPRLAGDTHYNRFFGSLRIGFNGIYCFSTYTLRLSTFMGFTIAGGSFLLMAIYLFYKLMGWNILWGNPTLVILISFLGGIQLISVGILGEYIGRIYDEVRERPKFIVESAEGFDQQSLTSGETEPKRPIARE
jgi:dolichol-phosphate mannosyltransferase